MIDRGAVIRVRQQMDDRFAEKVDDLTRFRAVIGDGEGNTFTDSTRTDVFIRRIGRGRVEKCQCTRISARNNLRVIVGYAPENPKVLQVLDVDEAGMQARDGYTYMGHHHQAHEHQNPLGGDDVVWVRTQQYLPLLMQPTDPPSMGVAIHPGRYRHGTSWYQWPGSLDIGDLSAHVPVAANRAVMVLVMVMAGLQALSFESSQEFYATTPEEWRIYFTPDPTADCVPIAAIYFYNGMTSITWNDIYDMRITMEAFYSTESGYGGAPHNLLSGTHADTFSDNPMRGDLVTASPTDTPYWQRLPVSAGNEVLTNDGTDTGWSGWKLIGVGGTYTFSTSGGTLPTVQPPLPVSRQVAYYGVGGVGVALTGHVDLSFDAGGQKFLAVHCTGSIPSARFHVRQDVVTTDALVEVMRVEGEVLAGAPAEWFGPALHMTGETSAATNVDMVKYAAAWKDPVSASRTSQAQIWTNHTGTWVLNGVIVAPQSYTAPIGNSRGPGAVDFQGRRGLITQVASGFYSTISGGFDNTAGATGATVGGGRENTSSELYTTVAGGWLNVASEEYSTVAGGYTCVASGYYSMVPGGRDNTAAGDYSFAAGRRAKIAAAHDGTFLWADQTNANFNSLALNEFALRARGGFRHAYDDANYWTAQVGATGIVTFDAVGAGATFAFSDEVTFNDSLVVPAGQHVSMADGTWLGIPGNELLTVNAAGTFAFSGIAGVSVEDGDWIGNSAATARVGFDSSGATDYAYVMGANLGVGTATPANPVYVRPTIAAAGGHYIDAVLSSSRFGTELGGGVALDFESSGGVAITRILSEVIAAGQWATSLWTIDAANNLQRVMTFREDGSLGFNTTTPIYPAGWVAPGFTLSSQAPTITFTDVGTADATRFIGNSAGHFYFGICDDDGANPVYIAILTSAGRWGVGTVGPVARAHIDQSSATGAIPVMLWDQADLSEEFLELTTTVGAGNPIDTAAIGAYYGKMRVKVTGVAGYKYIALYN